METLKFGQGAIGSKEFDKHKEAIDWNKSFPAIVLFLYPRKT